MQISPAYVSVIAGGGTLLLPETPREGRRPLLGAKRRKLVGVGPGGLGPEEFQEGNTVATASSRVATGIEAST